MHVNSVNSEIQAILSSTGMYAFLLPNYRPKLNPIELVFNVMAQTFKSRCYESMFNADYDVLAFLNEVIYSITPNIAISCYQKCVHDNYF